MCAPMVSVASSALGSLNNLSDADMLRHEMAQAQAQHQMGLRLQPGMVQPGRMVDGRMEAVAYHLPYERRTEIVLEPYWARDGRVMDLIEKARSDSLSHFPASSEEMDLGWVLPVACSALLSLLGVGVLTFGADLAGLLRVLLLWLLPGHFLTGGGF